MKSNVLQLKPLFLSFALILSACSDSKMRLGDLPSSGLVSENEQIHSNVNGYLSEADVSLSKDSSYIEMEASENLEEVEFNHQKWPKTCKDIADLKCDNVAGDKKVGVKDIKISGQVLIVDSSQHPWNSLTNQKNVRSLRIEADTVVLRSSLNLPNSNVEIIATKLIVEKDGQLNVTPSGPMDVHAAYGKDMDGKSLSQPMAYDGKEGLKGSTILVATKNLVLLGNKATPRFIARGGSGQNAGLGWGQSAEEFQKAPLYEAPRTPIGDVSKKFPSKANSIVFSGRHISKQHVKKIGHGDTSIEMHLAEHEEAKGSDVWPSDGKDAIAGGFPGAGGSGGVVRLFMGEESEFSESIADVSVGSNGKPDVVRFGSKGGLPNPAYKIRWSGGKASFDGVALDVPSLEEHFQKDGISVEGPKLPKSNNSPGRIHLEHTSTESNLDFSKTYFALKVKRIRALYLARKFTETVQLINQTEYQISQNSTESLSVIRAQLARMTNSLLNQKDYFGRGLNDVPNYTFNFNAAVYETQVGRAMRSYYLSRVFNKMLEDSKTRAALINETVRLMDEKFLDGVDSLAEGFKSISRIENEVNLTQRVQESIQNELEVINQQIEVLAKKNVASRKRAGELSRFLDVAAAVCQVIPAGQPALGLSATLAKTALKGAGGQSFAGYVDFYKSMKDQIKNYDRSADVATSKAQWNKFKDQFDYEHLRNKTIEEKGKYLSELYENLGPTIDKINETVVPLNQPIFGEDELQNEIAKIQTQDPVFGPIFSDISKKLQNLLERKAKIQKDLLEISLITEQVIIDLDSYVAFSAIASEEALNHKVDDGVLAKFYSEMSDRSQEDLLRLYSEATLAYEYVVLEKVPFDFGIFELRQKIDQILPKTTSDRAFKILSNFYDSQMGILKGKLQERLERMDSLTRTVSRGTNLVLSPSQLKSLNKDGYVDINLDSKIYTDAENVRVTEVSMAEDGYKIVTRQSKKDLPEVNLGLRFELGKEGALVYQGKKYSFHYPLAHEGMFRWEQYFQFFASSDVPKLWDVKRSDTTIGLFDTIGGGTEEHSRTNHAGLTKLRIRKLSLKTPFEFSKLIVTIKFEYSQKN